MESFKFRHPERRRAVRFFFSLGLAEPESKDLRGLSNGAVKQGALVMKGQRERLCMEEVLPVAVAPWKNRPGPSTCSGGPFLEMEAFRLAALRMTTRFYYFAWAPSAWRNCGTSFAENSERELCKIAFSVVPEERLKVARHFNAGKIKGNAARPVGMPERVSQRRFQPSLWDGPFLASAPRH